MRIPRPKPESSSDHPLGYYNIIKCLTRNSKLAMAIAKTTLYRGPVPKRESIVTWCCKDIAASMLSRNFCSGAVWGATGGSVPFFLSGVLSLFVFVSGFLSRALSVYLLPSSLLHFFAFSLSDVSTMLSTCLGKTIGTALRIFG